MKIDTPIDYYASIRDLARLEMAAEFVAIAAEGEDEFQHDRSRISYHLGRWREGLIERIRDAEARLASQAR